MNTGKARRFPRQITGEVATFILLFLIPQAVIVDY